MFSLRSFRFAYAYSIEEQMSYVMNEFAHGKLNSSNNNNNNNNNNKRLLLTVCNARSIDFIVRRTINSHVM